MHQQRPELDFFLREDVVSISRELLGMYLVTHFDGQKTIGKIVETEAYRADDDKACHAFGGRRTPRTEVMFYRGGHAYIYLCYGIHHLFNVVVGPAGMANAVLIRAIEPIAGQEKMLQRRNLTKVIPRLTAGPGSLSKALGIHKIWSGTDMLSPQSPIWLEFGESPIPEKGIISSPRVGIDYAEECVDWPWRFRVKSSQWTSPAK
ncbi:MAG: DNA-3-methyladenine glycosylase [Saprospiraceae bacterium]|nr:DNA-3-methyladenine glycosylase [Saprospiraceae bacterium]